MIFQLNLLSLDPGGLSLDGRHVVHPGTEKRLEAVERLFEEWLLVREQGERGNTLSFRQVLIERSCVVRHWQTVISFFVCSPHS